MIQLNAEPKNERTIPCWQTSSPASTWSRLQRSPTRPTGESPVNPLVPRGAKNENPPFNPFLPDCKTTFSGSFTFFYAIFKFQDVNMTAMPNSHLVLHKETLKQHFEN